MRNTRRRYKPSPLQVWKAQHHLLVRLIRAEKAKRFRSENVSRLKTFRSQSRLAFLQEQFADHMYDRKAAVEASRALFAQAQADYVNSGAARD